MIRDFFNEYTTNAYRIEGVCDVTGDFLFHINQTEYDSIGDNAKYGKLFYEYLLMLVNIDLTNPSKIYDYKTKIGDFEYSICCDQDELMYYCVMDEEQFELCRNDKYSKRFIKHVKSFLADYRKYYWAFRKDE